MLVGQLCQTLQQKLIFLQDQCFWKKQMDMDKVQPLSSLSFVNIVPPSSCSAVIFEGHYMDVYEED